MAESETFTAEEVKRLATKPPPGAVRQRVHVLGVGGVGSNIVRQAARGCGPSRFGLKIYDGDTVEVHNLNRTSLFHLNHVGLPKTRAVKSALTDGGLGVAVASVNRTSGGRSPNELITDRGEMTDDSTVFSPGIIVDARDTLDPSKMAKNTWIKLAYDGGNNISFTLWPFEIVSKILDLSGGSNYEVVPSFYVPAALLSVMAFNFMRFLNLLEAPRTKAGTTHFDFDGLIERISYAWEPEGAEAETAEAADGEEGAAPVAEAA